MIDKLIIDDVNIELSEKDTLPLTYQFSTAKTHTVKYALSDTDEISAGAFANCSYMTRVTFPPQIKMIKRRAFENCSRLNNVVIPKTIKYIGANVWDGCTSLTEMHFEHTGGENDQIPTNSSEIPAGCKVYIPNDSKYKMVEKDETGKNINMNPDSVDYYSCTKYNMYQYVAPALLNDTDIYYYDAWTSIAPNNKTIEEKNRVEISSIDLKQTEFFSSPNTQFMAYYSILPEDATNRKLYFFNSGGESSPIKIDSSVEGELLIESTAEAYAKLSIYAESGASATCTINIRRE